MRMDWFSRSLEEEGIMEEREGVREGEKSTQRK